MRARMIVAALALGLLLPLGGAREVAAQTEIVVTHDVDEVSDDGECSLREAVLSANGETTDCGDSLTGPFVIVLQSGGTYTLSVPGVSEDDGLTGDLDVGADVTIQAANAGDATISGGSIDRVLDVHPEGMLTLAGITVTQGQTVAMAGLSVDDQFLFAGAGIRNEGSLTLNSSVVTGNLATGVYDEEGTSGIANGGGIYNAGSLVMDTSSLTANQARVGQPGIGGGFGGGLYNHGGSAAILNSQITGNGSGGRSGTGGGIYSTGGEISLTDSAVSSNGSGGVGGIYNAGSLIMERTTISENDVYGGPGGVFNSGAMRILASTVSRNSSHLGPSGIANGGTLEIANSTISGNGTQYDGAVVNGGTLSLINSTITNNVVSPGADFAPGLVTGLNGTTTMRNTIIAGNRWFDSPSPDDCSGVVTSLGNNLIGKSEGCTIVGGGTDILDQDALLGPLSDNGGPTQTHHLLLGSPAIDSGDDAICEAPPVEGVDQRGSARPQDGDGDGNATCDIGAFELEMCPPEQPECHPPLDACAAFPDRIIIAVNFRLADPANHANVAVESPPIEVNIPPGSYAVTLQSHDAHSVHGGQGQRDERWFARFTAGDVVVDSGPIDDLPDDQDTMNQQVQDIAFTMAATQVVARHWLAGTPGFATPESVDAVCIALDPKPAQSLPEAEELAPTEQPPQQAPAQREVLTSRRILDALFQRLIQSMGLSDR